MPLEREMLADRSEAEEKFLRAFRVAKAAHAPLAFACRLVAILRPIVPPRCRLDEHNGMDAPTLTALMCQSASVVFNHLNEVGASIMTVTTVGIDLAKNVFQVHGVNEHGKVILKKQLKRHQVIEFFANMQPCLNEMNASHP